MKKLSRKVKSILLASVALVAVVAIVVCAVIFNKNGGFGPSANLNKQAQSFLDAQKEFASAVNKLEDNQYKAQITDASLIPAGKTFAFVHKNILVLRDDNNSDIETLYSVNGSNVTAVTFGESNSDEIVESSIKFQNGFALVSQSFETAGGDDYYLYSVVDVAENGSATLKASKKLEDAKALEVYAGESYLGVKDASANHYIIPYKSSVETKVFSTGEDCDFYKNSFALGGVNYDYYKSAIGFVCSDSIKLHDVTGQKEQVVIYTGADIFVVKKSNNYELVRVVDNAIYANALTLTNGYTSVMRVSPAVQDFSMIVSLCDDEENSEIAYYDKNMNLILKMYGYVDDNISPLSVIKTAGSLVTSEEINKNNRFAKEKIAYTTYYLTDSNDIISVNNTHLAQNVNFTAKDGYTLYASQDYLAVSQTNGYFNFINYNGDIVVNGSSNDLKIDNVVFMNAKYAIVNSTSYNNLCLFNISTSVLSPINTANETLVVNEINNKLQINAGIYYTRPTSGTGYNFYDYTGNPIATDVRSFEISNVSNTVDAINGYQNFVLYNASGISKVLTIAGAHFDTGETVYSSTPYSASMTDVTGLANSTKNIRYNNKVIGSCSVYNNLTQITLDAGWRIDRATITINVSETEYHLTTIDKTEILGSNISVYSNATHYLNGVADNADNGISYSIELDGEGRLVYSIPLGGESFAFKLTTATKYNTNTYVYFYALPSNSEFSNQINLMSYGLTMTTYGVTDSTITLPDSVRCLYGNLTAWKFNASNLVKKYNEYSDADLSSSLNNLGEPGETVDMSAYNSNVVFVFAFYDHKDTTTITIDSGNGIYNHTKHPEPLTNTSDAFVTVYEPIAPLGYHFTGWAITGHETSVEQSYRFKIDAESVYDEYKTDFVSLDVNTLFVKWETPSADYDAVEIVSLRDTTGNVNITAVYEANVYNIEYINVFEPEINASFIADYPTSAVCFEVYEIPKVKRQNWSFNGWIIEGLDTSSDHTDLGEDIDVIHYYGFDSDVRTLVEKDATSLSLGYFNTSFFFKNLSYVNGATITFTYVPSPPSAEFSVILPENVSVPLFTTVSVAVLNSVSAT